MVDNLKSSLDKKGLLIHRHFIMSPSVINVSRNEDLLDEDDVKALADLDENENRVDLLLEMIRSRGFEFYRKFLVVLRKTGHTLLADKLDPVAEKKKTVTFNPIPPVHDVTSESESSTSSSSTSSDSSSSDDSRRRKRKYKRKSPRKEEPKEVVQENLLKVPDLKFPQPTPSAHSPRQQHHQEASGVLDRLYVHYDSTKVNYRRSLEQLRHQEKQLRASLIVNRHEQKKVRRNLEMISSIKRQIAFVNDKQSMMKNADVASEEKLKELANVSLETDSYLI